MSIAANLAPVVGGGLAALAAYVSVRRMHRQVKKDADELKQMAMSAAEYQREPDLPLHVYVPTANVTGTYGSKSWIPGVKVGAGSYQSPMRVEVQPGMQKAYATPTATSADCAWRLSGCVSRLSLAFTSQLPLPRALAGIDPIRVTNCDNAALRRNDD